MFDGEADRWPPLPLLLAVAGRYAGAGAESSPAAGN